MNVMCEVARIAKRIVGNKVESNCVKRGDGRTVEQCEKGRGPRWEQDVSPVSEE